jgi:hypothetical protein
MLAFERQRQVSAVLFSNENRQALTYVWIKRGYFQGKGQG